MSKLPSLRDVCARSVERIPSLTSNGGAFGAHMFKGRVTSRPVVKVSPDALVVSNNRWEDRKS